jgi:hypothetical protein
MYMHRYRFGPLGDSQVRVHLHRSDRRSFRPIMLQILSALRKISSSGEGW